jgi:hypothetical protein
LSALDSAYDAFDNDGQPELANRVLARDEALQHGPNGLANVLRLALQQQ